MPVGIHRGRRNLLGAVGIFGARRDRSGSSESIGSCVNCRGALEFVGIVRVGRIRWTGRDLSGLSGSLDGLVCRGLSGSVVIVRICRRQSRSSGPWGSIGFVGDPLGSVGIVGMVGPVSTAGNVGAGLSRSVGIVGVCVRTVRIVGACQGPSE